MIIEEALEWEAYLNISALPIIKLNRNLIVTYSNQATFELLMITPADIIGINFLDLIKRDQIPIVEKNLKLIINGSQRFVNIKAIMDLSGRHQKIAFSAARVPPEGSLRSFVCQIILVVEEPTRNTPTEFVTSPNIFEAVKNRLTKISWVFYTVAAAAGVLYGIIQELKK